MAEMGWTGTAIPETLRRRRLRLPRALRDRRGAGAEPGARRRSRPPSTSPPRRSCWPAARRRSGGGCRGSPSGEAIGCLALAEGPAGADAGNLTTRAAAARLTGTKAPVPTATWRTSRSSPAARTARPICRSSSSISPAPASRARRWPPWTPRARTRVSPSTARRPSRSAPPAPAGRCSSGCSTAPRCWSPSSRSAARRPRSTWRASTRSAASPSAGPSPRSRPSSTSSSTCTWRVELARSNAYYAAWALSTDAPSCRWRRPPRG